MTPVNRKPVVLETERLILRPWKTSDYEPYAEINMDREVMAFFTARMTRRESDTMVDYFQDLIEKRGWGVWAIERKSDGALVGSLGLHVPRTQLPFSPCIEIGWRLAKAFWKMGYATEAARAAIDYGFEVLYLPEIVSFTAVLNVPSQAVMQRLGMHTDPAQNFGHPKVPAGSPLWEHCLYRLTRKEWKAMKEKGAPEELALMEDPA